jgi:hypothetical protein
MKSTVKAREIDTKYPKLIVHKSTGVILLTTSRGISTVLRSSTGVSTLVRTSMGSGLDTLQAGDAYDGYTVSEYEDFKGQLILEND